MVRGFDPSRRWEPLALHPAGVSQAEVTICGTAIVATVAIHDDGLAEGAVGTSVHSPHSNWRIHGSHPRSHAGGSDGVSRPG